MLDEITKLNSLCHQCPTRIGIVRAGLGVGQSHTLFDTCDPNPNFTSVNPENLTNQTPWPVSASIPT